MRLVRDVARGPARSALEASGTVGNGRVAFVADPIDADVGVDWPDRARRLGGPHVGPVVKGCAAPRDVGVAVSGAALAAPGRPAASDAPAGRP